MTELLKGRKHTEEWKRKHSEMMKGHHVSEEQKKKISEANKGERNGMWKEKINYISLHQWINDNLPKAKLCQICNLVPPYDCVNVTGIYNRDFNNWLRGCRKCHMISDGRLERFKTNPNRNPYRDSKTGRFVSNA
jgi:hypothetical protein